MKSLAKEETKSLTTAALLGRMSCLELDFERSTTIAR
jgi:hypothetical protein